MNKQLPLSRAMPDRSSAYPYAVARSSPRGVDRPLAPDDTSRDGFALNHLLASLPAAERNALRPHLERAAMSAGAVLHECGRASRYAWFPATSIVSLAYDSEDGARSPIAMVGREGMVGIALLLGDDGLQGSAEVQCAGDGFRIPARVLREACERSAVLQRMLLRYAQALMMEIAQNGVCSRHHPVGRQLCRCLLRSADCVAGNELLMTHEAIADALGLRRECISVAAGKLRREGLIDYRRGHIKILDRSGLEAQACECHGVVSEALRRLRHGNAGEAHAGPDTAAASRDSHLRLVRPP